MNFDLSKLTDKNLLVVSGKGGVGKTTVAAALGVLLSQKGKRALVAEINSTGRLPHIYNKQAKGDEIVDLAENLWTVNVNPKESLEEYALLTLKYRTLYNIVFKNRMVKYFLKAVPALAEITMLGRLWYIAMLEEEYRGAGPFDVIIIDAPATGHFKSFLLTPEALEHLTPPGPMRTNSANIDKWLRNPQKTGFVLVTLPREMPVNEAVELSRFMKKVGRMELLAVIANQVSPFFTYKDKLGNITEKIKGASCLESSAADMEKLVELSVERQKLLKSQSHELGRLDEEIGWPKIALPRLNSAHLTPEDLEYFGDILTGETGTDGLGAGFNKSLEYIFDRGCNKHA